MISRSLSASLLSQRAAFDDDDDIESSDGRLAPVSDDVETQLDELRVLLDGVRMFVSGMALVACAVIAARSDDAAD